VEGLRESCVKLLVPGGCLATVVMTRLLLCTEKVAANNPVQGSR
jgi:hypothetical protein